MALLKYKYVFLFIAAIALIVVWFFSNEEKKVEEQKIHRYGEQEALKLLNELISAVNPSRPENVYLPIFARDKIDWVYGQHATRQLEFVYTSRYIGEEKGKATFMSSEYKKDGKAVIYVLAPRLLYYVRQQQKVAKGFNQRAKNIFAVALVHEAVHLELGEEYLKAQDTKEEKIEEEMRAWFRVDLMMVRPLRKINQPLEIDLLEADDILKKCNDEMNCPEFRKFIEQRFRI